MTAAATAVGLVAGWPATALAATVSRADGGRTLVYTADPGEYNRVTFSGDDRGGQKSITVQERGCSPSPSDLHACGSGSVPYPVNADPSSSHCVGGPGQAVCDAGAISAIRVILGDQDNTCGFSNVDLPVAVYGGPGNNDISGTDKPSLLVGGDGDNTIAGGAAADTIIGGSGNDRLSGGGGDDYIDAGPSGDNKVTTGDGNVTVVTHQGTNFIEGGKGNDTLIDGPGADHFAGHGGIDTVSYAGRTKPVNISPGSGPNDGEPNEHDEIAPDVQVLIGGSGDDRIVAPDPPAGSGITGYTLIGGPGDDTLIAHKGNDTLDGGPGDDLLTPGTGPDKVIGGPGTDTVSYAGHSEGVKVTLDGKPDSGAPGENTAVMPDVEDIAGGDGNDTLIGNDARNKISGGAGDDVIDGVGGDNVLNGGPGANTIKCGPGKSIVNYSWETEPITFAPGSGAISGAANQHDTIGPGCPGVIGSEQDDVLIGGPGPTFLYGNAGDNTIYGGPSAGDLIVARDGDNYIDAMDGHPDYITCGDGKNTVLADPTDSIAPNCQKDGDNKVIGTAVNITPAARVRAAGTRLTVPVTCQPLLREDCAGTISYGPRSAPRRWPRRPSARSATPRSHR